MAALLMSLRRSARLTSAASCALALSLASPSYAEAPTDRSRFEIRDSAVRSVQEPDAPRFVMSAKLQAPKPEVDPNARFTASAQLKATTASCGAAGDGIFTNGFEGN